MKLKEYIENERGYFQVMPEGNFFGIVAGVKSSSDSRIEKYLNREVVRIFEENGEKTFEVTV